MAEEAKKEEQAAEKKEVEVPEKFKALVEQIEKMSVLELSELVKVLEEKFGVSAAAPMMAMAGMPAAGGEAGEAAEEKSDFDIELVASGDAKINVIKVVREITGKGLKEAKDLVDAAPKVIKEKAPKAEAEEIKKKLEDAGATVNLK
jgi:large subunit ribosomal protein L7/L12